MNHARSLLTVLFLLGSLAGATQATASEGNSSPLSVTSYEVNVLRGKLRLRSRGPRSD